MHSSAAQRATVSVASFAFDGGSGAGARAEDTSAKPGEVSTSASGTSDTVPKMPPDPPGRFPNARHPTLPSVDRVSLFAG
jgi:hypothetical protein